MHLEQIRLSNFRCFREEETRVYIDKDMTCLLGNNGSGKTALLMALKRLFGSTREERTIIKDDFYIASDDDIENIDGRELYIEAIFAFPELQGDIEQARKTCAAFSSVIHTDKNDGIFKARMRLEAKWNEIEYEDDVQTKIYWVITSENIEFGENKDLKMPIPEYDRKQIKLRYVPASRDEKSTLKNEVRSLAQIIKKYADIPTASEDEIKEVSEDLNEKLQKVEAVESVTNLLTEIWSEAHDNTLEHYQAATLEAAPVEMQKLLASISVKLGLAPDKSNHDISKLSDGQISLIYFALSITLYEIEQKHHAKQMAGFKTLEKDIPIFTIFALEEPENHLSPYYLGKMLDLLSWRASKGKATGIITSHSPSVVRRMNEVQQIRHFYQKESQHGRYSEVNQFSLLKSLADEDYKYINQAILAHPELYFSKLVILGEGASEEIVIPKLAKKLDFDLDPSFVAFVKLGGRHVNHMWRLLDDLRIPFLTVLDLDFGRKGGGAGRIKYIAEYLNEYDDNFLSLSKLKFEDLQSDELGIEKLKPWLDELEKYNIFYSSPLDLDMAMIQAFPSCYDDKGQLSERSKLINAVLGESHAIDYIGYTDEHLKKYRNLFLTNSKVVSHYCAIANILKLDDNEIKTNCPEPIKNLIERASKFIKGQ